MKVIPKIALLRIVFLLALAAALVFPSAALAQGPSGDKFVMGGTYTLESGQTLDGSLFVLGGLVELKEGSRVTRDLLLAGGTATADGKIDGNIFVTGGLINLGDTAEVGGDVNSIAARLNRAPGAVIHGQVNNATNGPYEFGLPGGGSVPEVSVRVNPLWEALWFLLRAFLWAALAVLVVMFLPRQTEQVARTAFTQPLITGGLGLLTAVVVPIILVVAAITIIGIPFTLLGALLLAVAWAFGLVSLGAEVGRRLAIQMRQDWAPALSAGVGAFLLILVVQGIDKLIPCLGWLAPALVGFLALGAVVLTRFGTQPYPPAAPPAGTGLVPPVPPPSPSYVTWPPAEPPVSSPETEGGAQEYPSGPA